MSYRLQLLDRLHYAWCTATAFEKMGMICAPIMTVTFASFIGYFVIDLSMKDPRYALMLLAFVSSVAFIIASAVGFVHYSMSFAAFRRDAPNSYRDYQRRR